MSDPQPQPDDRAGRCEIHNNRAEIAALGERVVRAAEQAGFGEASRFAVRLALEEAIVNAFKHGHSDLKSDVPVRVDYEVLPDRITIAVTDQGPGFDPNSVPDPTTEENLTKTSGRGLLLMRAYMTTVTHNPRGNTITMVYEKPAPDG
ncbi:MAG TPA: ATP-binding protein [Phycisphaerales bacterium]|nr:ATP-binding protein [Phycisphaerales bacterium]